MGDPISTSDLYGPSASPDAATPSDSQQPEKSPVTPPTPLVYEETPEIAPIVVDSSGQPAPPPPPLPKPGDFPKPGTVPQKPPEFLRHIGTIIFFIGMFIVGIWASSFIRQFLPGLTTPTPTPTAQVTPTPIESNLPSASGSATALIDWKQYGVISSTTRQPIPGLTFELPPSVLPPICDGTSCVSQGTYLPGGTRFTVAPRGTGQVLKDYRGNLISDLTGIKFTTSPTTVGGLTAVDFSGTFIGQTVSGYGFSKMHGVMINLSDTLSLEVNHFTPNGITADFTSDEEVFTQILQTLSASGGALGTKGATIPTTLLTATPKPATASGY